MQLPNVPGWGQDFLGHIIHAADHNTRAAFANRRPQWSHLSEVLDLLQKASDNLNNTSKWFVVPFLIRSQSCYVAAVRLGTGGQLPEAHAILRTCLENALYGFYLASDGERQRLWLDRNTSDAAKKKMVKEFKLGEMMKALKAVDCDTHRVVKLLYDRTIDYGAHPNPQSILPQSRQEEVGTRTEFGQTWMTGDCLAMRLCLKTAAAVGLAALHVFANVWRERFDILGIRQAMLDLREPRRFEVYGPDTAELES